jgi:hypothetical protein
MQTVGWLSRPFQFVERARAKYGDTFTMHIARDTFVVLSDPADVKQVFTGDPHVFHAGEGNSILEPLVGRHSYAGFGHLTGYGACYYTYQWSLVIARDLLSGFDGNLMDAEAATRYRREILEPGGRRDATDLVEAFLGRPYRFDAYREWLAGA